MKALGEEIAGIAESARPAVVQVRTQSVPKMSDYDRRVRELEEFFGRGRGRGRRFAPRESHPPVSGVGSGFFIDAEGTILTNSHVVEDMDLIQVLTADGRELDAVIVGSDPHTEVALIKVKGNGDFPYLELGDSDSLRVGHFVMTIGSPQGLAQSVTFGIVSALERDELGITDFGRFIQTDAAINLGNSGGPMLDADGKVVGISTAIISTSGGSQGLGLAIPINQAREVADILMREGVVHRGFLGIFLDELTPELALHFGTGDTKGALVADVMEGMPAEGKLERGDALVGVNGKSVKGSKDFRDRIAAIAPGKTVRVTIIRGGKKKTVKLKLAERPGSGELNRTFWPQEDEEADEEEKKLALGITVRPLTPRLARDFGYVGLHGVVVTHVENSSEAYREGIRANMLITQINQVDVRTHEDLNKGFRAGSDSETVLLQVHDGKGYRYVVLDRKK